MKKIRIRTILISALFLFIAKENILAQQSGRMETDRPDQTESPFITKTNYLQGELGFNREFYNDRKSWVAPTTLFKFGLSTKFEFRLITEFESFRLSSLEDAKPSNGIPPVQLGAKIALFEEKGILPLTSVIFHTGIPFLSSSNFKTSSISPNFRFTMQHTLCKTVSLGYNLGATWDGESKIPSWIYTIAPGKNFGKNWYGYVELFGEIGKSKSPQHGFDAGIAYYINDDLKLDFSAGKGLSKYAFDKYVAIGFSFRLPI